MAPVPLIAGPPKASIAPNRLHRIVAKLAPLALTHNRYAAAFTMSHDQAGNMRIRAAEPDGVPRTSEVLGTTGVPAAKRAGDET